MKLRATPLIFVLISISCNVFSISLGRYQHLCGQPGNLSFQGKGICKAHQARIHSQHRYNQHTRSNVAQSNSESSPHVIYDSQHKRNTKPTTTSQSTTVTRPTPQPKVNQSSRERREQLKFTPYTPGAFSIVKKEEKDES